VHDGSNKSYLKVKKKGKGKAHSEQEEEGNSFDGSSGSKGGKGKKGKPKCGYCNHDSHPESTCMKKQIDLMVQVLQKNNLWEHIPKGSQEEAKRSSTNKTR
jgi:hypothetical protein